MILIVNLCSEKLHYFEFVKPIEDILQSDFFTKHYLEINKNDLEKADRVIICGTSLMDFSYINNLEKFNWIKDFKKPILGICAGCQIIGKIFECDFFEGVEIGYFNENFSKDFLGLNGKIEVYHLHKKYINFSDEFLNYTDSNIFQAVKHKEKEIYGTLFHPEVRNKEMILNFANL